MGNWDTIHQHLVETGRLPENSEADPSSWPSDQPWYNDAKEYVDDMSQWAFGLDKELTEDFAKDYPEEHRVVYFCFAPYEGFGPSEFERPFVMKYIVPYLPEHWHVGEASESVWEFSSRHEAISYEMAESFLEGLGIQRDSQMEY